MPEDLFRVLVADDLSPKAIATAVAAYHREGLDAAQKTNRAALGRLPDVETAVDGRYGAALDTVKPNGAIVSTFEVEIVNDALVWIAEMLSRHAPRLTGRFADSFVLFGDGVEIRVGEAFGQVKEFVFLSQLPYAKRLERGWSSQAPSGVFQGVAVMARQRFGNVARVDFGYRSTLLDYVALGGRKGGKTASPAKRSAHNIERETRVPAIIVTVR